MSPSVCEFLTSLTATHAQPVFKRSAAAVGCKIVSPRGSPENSGDAFEVSHPVVRTNPVTGWRSIYAVGLHCRDIDGLTEYESDRIKEYFDYMITHHHDLQVRFRWNPNDIAIWDNRLVYHSGTPDLVGEREGRRTTSVGERPYFDPASTTRRGQRHYQVGVSSNKPSNQLRDFWINFVNDLHPGSGWPRYDNQRKVMQLKRDNIIAIPDDWDVEKTDFSNTELGLGEFQK